MHLKSTQFHLISR